MLFSEYASRLLSLAETVHRWLEELSSLDRQRRLRVANYAEKIAGTLQRAADAMAELEAKPGDKKALRQAVAELGRIAGYIETMMGVLEQHLDGRKLAGVKKRLELLDQGESLEPPGCSATSARARSRMERLAAAEGYFKALADSLRV